MLKRLVKSCDVRLIRMHHKLVFLRLFCYFLGELFEEFLGFTDAIKVIGISAIESLALHRFHIVVDAMCKGDADILRRLSSDIDSDSIAQDDLKEPLRLIKIFRRELSTLV